MAPRVDVIVVNWNGSADTIECVSSLMPGLGTEIARIIIVDNGSGDDSVARLQEWAESLSDLDSERVVLLQNDRNEGYARGCNSGIRWALQRDPPEFLWLLNNDVIAGDRALAQLIHTMDTKPGIGLLGSTIIDYYDRSTVHAAGGGRYNFMLTLNRPMMKGASVQEVKSFSGRLKLDYVAGAAMFLRTAALQRVGFFYEGFFLYFEELEFCRRLDAAGYALDWCFESFVFHKSGAVAGSRSVGRSGKSFTAEFYSSRSAIHFTRLINPLAAPVVLVIRIILRSIHALLHGEFSLVPAVFRGSWAGLLAPRVAGTAFR